MFWYLSRLFCDVVVEAGVGTPSPPIRMREAHRHLFPVFGYFTIPHIAQLQGASLSQPGLKSPILSQNQARRAS